MNVGKSQIHCPLGAFSSRNQTPIFAQMEDSLRTAYLIQPTDLVEYGAGVELQERYFHQLLAEKAAHPERQTVADYLIALQHPPVFTLGKSGKAENLLVSKERLQEEQIGFYPTSRGGDITYHGPGQLVVYPIFDLDQHFTDIHRYLRTLEEAVIRTLAEYGIIAGRSEGQTGVWIGDRKICAMGVKASRWIVMHGLALNINPNLDHFRYIVPCNIADKDVTSMGRELGTAPPFHEVEARLLHHLADLFQLRLQELPQPSPLLA